MAFDEVLSVVRRKRKTHLRERGRSQALGGASTGRWQKEPVMGPTPESTFWSSKPSIPDLESRRGFSAFLHQAVPERVSERVSIFHLDLVQPSDVPLHKEVMKEPCRELYLSVTYLKASSGLR